MSGRKRTSEQVVVQDIGGGRRELRITYLYGTGETLVAYREQTREPDGSWTEGFNEAYDCTGCGERTDGTRWADGPKCDTCWDAA